MKISTKIIPFLMILITILALIGCSDSGEGDEKPISYTVTFSSQFNNTESTTVMPNPTSITVDAGETVVTLPTAPSMSGYRFGGWWTGKNGAGSQFTESTIVNFDIIVYAYWYNYQVTFNNNGEIYATRGITLPEKTVSSFPTSPTSTDYNFAGWYTAPDGGGNQFFPSTEVTADITVYARWVTQNVYTVTYNSEGGSIVGTQYVVAPATTVGALPTDPTKPFYAFNGWTYGCCGAAFTADTPVTDNMTAYASWTETSGYTVIYDSYGGTAVEDQYVISPATNVGTLPPNPTKRCFAFAGWYTEANGEGTEFTATTTVDNSNTTDDGKITVYANWEWNYPSTTYPLITAPFEVGDYGPSCVGKVFHITDGGAHGLEAAPPNWYEGGEASSIAWIYGDPATDENDQVYQRTQSTLNGNTSTAIGTGLANSNAIVAQVEAVGGTTTPYAAQICLDYSVGEGTYEFDDWYLPSQNELAELYANRDVKRSGGFSDEGYWSSSEYGQWDGWSQYFSDGRQTGTSKGSGRMIRPIRTF